MRMAKIRIDQVNRLSTGQYEVHAAGQVWVTKRGVDGRTFTRLAGEEVTSLLLDHGEIVGVEQ
jgi:hypothetical protein